MSKETSIVRVASISREKVNVPAAHTLVQPSFGRAVISCIAIISYKGLSLVSPRFSGVATSISVCLAVGGPVVNEFMLLATILLTPSLRFVSYSSSW